ncbi:DUF2336 domain-containing protein [Sneathiella aquimaris]|uniref:DUF2336 domain-containing protein n=1 Tax=Sneathiella aquimaris TaxID=2599305 RepID=UPI00146AE5C7|nr:DUF2336 domain-containing protein [Sneathiella aquimaris]
MSSDGQQNINQILNLVELAEDKSPTQRKFLYEKIGNFLCEEEGFSRAEKELMADIMCRITSDVERSVRASFSKNICKNNDIPIDLVIFLANEEYDVALPILQDCGLLEEEDLCEVVRTRSVQHQLAVAARNNIGEAVSRALSDTNNNDVCLCLLENKTAAIPEDVLELFCIQSQTILEYQKPLLQRPFLPEKIAQKMYQWVSIALREYIVSNFDISPDLLVVSADDQAQSVKDITSDSDPSSMLVDKLFSAGELSNGFLLKSLRQGEIDLFELSFAKLLDVPRKDVQKILYADDPQLLAVACRVLGLDPIVFSTIFDLTNTALHSGNEFSAEQKEQAVGFYSLLKLDAAKRALKNKDFINGLIKYSQTSS